MNQNPIYNIWDYNYIQQQAQQYHQSQVRQVLDCAKKLQDFLDSSDQVASEYQNALLAECCAVLYNHGKKNRYI